MAVHLVRHAQAGSRRDWQQPDANRPLSPAGARQAAALADAIAAELVPHADVRLVASPALRCRQTLEPLAARLGIDVTTEAALAEGGTGAPALDVLLALHELAPEIVACSHGDVIPAVVDVARRRGALVEGDGLLAKAGRVRLEVRDGAVVRVASVAPPR